MAASPKTDSPTPVPKGKINDAEPHGHDEPTPKGTPSDARHATERAAAVIEGVEQAETHDPAG
jgi:hypothetical protein